MRCRRFLHLLESGIIQTGMQKPSFKLYSFLSIGLLYMKAGIEPCRPVC